LNDGRSCTSLMKSTSVSARPELTATLVRLMLSVNDIALAADANDQWAETGDRKRAAMRNAARGYFVRVLLSHLSATSEPNRVIAPVTAWGIAAVRRRRGARSQCAKSGHSILSRRRGRANRRELSGPRPSPRISHLSSTGASLGEARRPPGKFADRSAPQTRRSHCRNNCQLF
jgi:hypothetical protein